MGARRGARSHPVAVAPRQVTPKGVHERAWLVVCSNYLVSERSELKCGRPSVTSLRDLNLQFMSDMVKALQTIREFWFNKTDITDAVIKELGTNYMIITGSKLATTYESWQGRTFIIDYRYKQITLVNRGYEVTTF